MNIRTDMRPALLTADQMRALETAEIDAGRTTGAALMERAGQGVVGAILARWPRLAARPGRALVLCGPGNNGGDGFVIARRLKRLGWRVRVELAGDPSALSGDARGAADRWLAAGAVHDLQGAESTEHWDIVVDAVFGTGLRRPVAGAIAARFEALNAVPAGPVIAVDLPSGLCSDSGRMLGTALRADLTVTFHSLKPGHVLQSAAICGMVHVHDIGLPRSDIPEAARLVVAPDAAGLRKSAGHKFRHGHALVIAGGPRRTGAARMAARAALRTGAGLVTVAGAGPALSELASHLTAEMLVRVEGAEALSESLAADPRISAVCLGPALGVSPDDAALVGAVLRSGRHAVLDADALTLVAADPALFACLHAGVVLTPHDGEFARLFPDLAARLGQTPLRGPALSRIDVARDAAARAGCVVLLKGPDTVIASPDGAVMVHAARGATAAPELATAGAGDVLAGIITGLLARGTDPARAAAQAAWLHAAAARAVGAGMIATDLAQALPEVLAGLR